MHGFTYNRRLIKLPQLVFIIPYAGLFTLFLARTAVSWDRIAVCLGIVCIQAARYFFSRHGKADSLYCYALTILEFLLIIKLFYGTRTEIETIVFAIFTADLIFYHQSVFSLISAYVGYAIYSLLWGIFSEDLFGAVISSVNYCVFIAAIWSVKVLLKQRETILQLNKKILEQSTAMEDLAKLKERNRIAEEVHNTVGHQLTTAIVSLEGAHLLFNKKPEDAHEKLNIARRQLKEGLGNIRELVRTIHSGGVSSGGASLVGAIEELIRGVQLRTGIPVDFDFEIHNKLLSLQEHVLLSAVKEGLTNAIKHSEPGYIGITVTGAGDRVQLIIENDGMGGSAVVEGFGLTTLRENAEAIGGKITYEHRSGSFLLCLSIPFVEEEPNEKD